MVGFPASGFAEGLGGRYISVPRGDLAAAIFRTIEGKVETVFGDSVESLSQNDARVQVKFASGATREFDLVVGADGLHSRVRALVFGPEQQFEKYLGYKAAAFQGEAPYGSSAATSKASPLSGSCEQATANFPYQPLKT